MKYVPLLCFFLFSVAFSASISIPSPMQVINNIARLIAYYQNEEISQNVEFFLYTHKNRNSGQQIWIDNNDSIRRSNFNASVNTKIVVHGWRSNHTSLISTLVKNAFLKQDRYNVILVNWGAIAQQIYPISVAKLNKIGEYVGKMIVYLENGRIDLKKLTVVGHSLGAHIVGLAGRYVYKTINKSVLHIVGLDPANPGFEIMARNFRLSSADADQVEVIHSNMGLNGLFEAVGDLDFYPNFYLSQQPGCGFDVVGSCAHSRSYFYYAEAIKRPRQWVAIKCDSFLQFLSNGCQSNEIAAFPLWTANFTRTPGTYVLVTNSSEPFGVGLKGVNPRTFFDVLVD